MSKSNSTSETNRVSKLAKMDFGKDFEEGSTRRRHVERTVRRLRILGVGDEYLRRIYRGIVQFAKGNRSQIPELVTAILPTDEEVTDTLREVNIGSKELSVGPTMLDEFRESMVWLKWLMFEGEPVKSLEDLSKMSVTRGVCGASWGAGDIAYKCRTCENDSTCAICVSCFQNGNHKDHEYSIIYSGGGCCDCGDVTAWEREGFCSQHKGAEQIQPLPDEYASSVGTVLDALLICWKDKLHSAEISKESKHVVRHTKCANELTFAVVEMLLVFCKYSDSLLSFVSKRVTLSAGLLNILVRAERFLSELVVKKLHALLLKFLGEPIYKYEFAKVFVTYYPFMVNEAVKHSSDGVLRKYPLLSTFSVQIFTVPTLTSHLVKEMNLLTTLLGSLTDVFASCIGEDGQFQVSKLGNLSEVTAQVFVDIKYVMRHSVVSQYVIHEQRDIMRTWMRVLGILQGMDPLKRETDLHIEKESGHSKIPFFLCHYTSRINSLLVDGAFSKDFRNETDNVRCSGYKRDREDGHCSSQATLGRMSQETSKCRAAESGVDFASGLIGYGSEPGYSFHHPIPLPVTLLISLCLRAIENWLVVVNTSGSLANEWSGDLMSISSENDSDGCDSKGCDNIAMVGDKATELDSLHVLSFSDWPSINYDVSSQDVSVHIPIHHLLGILLHRALRKCFGEYAMEDITSSSPTNQSAADYCNFFRHVLVGCHPCGFSAFVMEHPLRNRVFCAQVYAGMWRKNGYGAYVSCNSYRSTHWSDQGFQLDLFLMQFCAAVAPVDLYVSRILERFGLSEYLYLNVEGSSKFEPMLVQEMLTLIIQIVQERRFSGMTTAENVKRELIHKLATGDATHSQLMKSLPRDISKFDKLHEILDTVAVHSNPSGFKQGMYSLCLAHWKEIDLYNPRWNLRDLQVAEERYMRFCGVSALTTQLPRWTSIYPPLKNVARLATCRTTFQIIHAVLYYAVLSETRASDSVLLSALHLISLALDICSQQKESIEETCYCRDSTPILALACETFGGLESGNGEQSLLSFLVSLMRMHKKENTANLMEPGNCNLSSLIESLLKRFAEIDTGCLKKLQQLAPELVVHLSKFVLNDDKITQASDTDGEKWKARAREKQAAILEKMKAEQSKFLSTSSPIEDDGFISELETSNSGINSMHDVCSLCHNTNSRNLLSFLVLLQKSRLLSVVNGSRLYPDSMVFCSSAPTCPTRDSGMISSPQMAQVEEISRIELSSSGRSEEVSADVNFPKARSANFGNIQPTLLANDGQEKTSNEFDAFEQYSYDVIRSNMCDSKEVFGWLVENKKLPGAKGGLGSDKKAESALVAKYIAALYNETTVLFASENVRNDTMPAENAFGPRNCDGVHISSCGHAVHQECLDRYLSSLRERHGRMVFIGGHLADLDQGEFLCPVCRSLANSVLPALHGDFCKLLKQPIFAAGSSCSVLGSSATSAKEIENLWLCQALSLLHSAAKVVEKGEILKALPLDKSVKMRPNINHASLLLSKMYFEGEHDILSSSLWVLIMWDTLKYSLMSLEIAARCKKTSLSPTHGISSLYKELKSCNGFVLSLLLRIIQCHRSQNSVLQRFQGLRLFAESIFLGTSTDCQSRKFHHEGDKLTTLKFDKKGISFPDVQFWDLTSDPILTHDPFSSLMWVLFCLPSPFLSCKNSLASLVHLFYAVSVTQAIIAYCTRYPKNIRKQSFDGCLISDIFNDLGETRCVQQDFLSICINPAHEILDAIRRLTLPFLRRCAMLWKLLNSSVSAPFRGNEDVEDEFPQDVFDNDITMIADDVAVYLDEAENLETMFKIPVLNIVTKDQVLRSLVRKWLYHFQYHNKIYDPRLILHCTPATPFKLISLPHLYHDLLERCINQRCLSCKSVLVEPALCLLCGRLCSRKWEPCCGNSECQSHSNSCGAGTGVFVLIMRTTIILQKSASQVPWPSLYLDAFGEERKKYRFQRRKKLNGLLELEVDYCHPIDLSMNKTGPYYQMLETICARRLGQLGVSLDIEMQRGKPLYLNEERYAALTYMVASHGFDQSSEFLGQTTIDDFFLV